MPGSPPPVPAPARRTGPGRGPRFVCAGPARASAGTRRPRESPARPGPTPSRAARAGSGGIRAQRGGPRGAPRCWARHRFLAIVWSRSRGQGRPGDGGWGGDRGAPSPASLPTGPAPDRPHRYPGSGRSHCPAERGLRPRGHRASPAGPATLRFPQDPGLPHPWASLGGRGVSARDCPAGLGLLLSRGGEWLSPPGAPAARPARSPARGTRCRGRLDPGPLQGASPTASPPASPSPAGCREAAWGHLLRDPLPALQGASGMRGGNAAGTLGRISLGRAGALDGVGCCWLHAVHDAFGGGRTGAATVRPPSSQGHPPPLRDTPTTHPGTPTSQLGCTHSRRLSISNQVPALRTGLCGPGQVGVPASPGGLRKAPQSRCQPKGAVGKRRVCCRPGGSCQPWVHLASRHPLQRSRPCQSC